MKKILLFSLIACSSANVYALTRTSVANGDWSNPNTWSPAGVPLPSDDSIIIATNVTFSVNIADGQAMFRIYPGASLIDLGQDTIALGGDNALITGYMSCYVLAVGMNNQFYNDGTISVARDLGQSGTFINAPSGSICVGNMLATSDNFTNNGSVATYNWTNSGTTTGSGRFCIANYFINGDNITGTLDICDATPNTMWDVNAGTIAGTVTYCTVGPCGNCAPAGIHDINHDAWVVIGPNPFAQDLTVNFDRQVAASSLSISFELYDATGKLIDRFMLSGGENHIDGGALASGICFYRVVADGTLITSGKLIRE